MSEYVAPLRDMKFGIEVLGSLDDINILPGFEDCQADLLDAVLNEAARFAAEVLAPLNVVGDQNACRLENDVVHTPPGWQEAYRLFVEGGWVGLACAPEHGGQGLPQLVAAAVEEMWNAANLSFAIGPMLTRGAGHAVEHHGSAAQKAHYLKRMVSGEWTGTMNLTEPQAGSDLGTVRTKALPEGDHYRISGQKIFITYGEHDLTDNIIHLVLARTPDAPAGTRGISLFIVPKFLVNDDGSLGERNDLRCTSIEHKLGIHGSPTAVMTYGEHGGAIGYLVGEQHRGLAYMFTMMNAARHAVGLEGLALAEAAYQKALNFARERVQGRPPGVTTDVPVAIIEHPDVRRMLMMMRAQTEAMRAVAYVCAAAFDRSAHEVDADLRAYYARRADLLTPIVKAWCTETGQTMTSMGVQVHGGMGFIEETGAAQYFRDARITTIYEGTTGIQANDFVGRKTQRDGGTAARELLHAMRADCAALEDVDDRRVARLRSALAQSCDQVEEALAWVLSADEQDPRNSAAAAVNYLKLWGITAGGWQFARAARVCVEHISAGDDDPFYPNKLAVAAFFASQVMPQTLALKTTIIDGCEVVMGLEADAM